MHPFGLGPDKLQAIEKVIHDRLYSYIMKCALSLLFLNIIKIYLEHNVSCKVAIMRATQCVVVTQGSPD